MKIKLNKKDLYKAMMKEFQNSEEYELCQLLLDAINNTQDDEYYELEIPAEFKPKK